MPKGDCFQVAILLVSGNPNDNWEGALLPGGKIVHGLPTGMGQENFGEEYWHAWVEIVEGGVPTVVDYSNDKRTKMPRDEYYEHGRIKQVWRFNQHQARAQYKKFDHAGPWVKGWWWMGDAHKMSVREATNDDGVPALLAKDANAEARWFAIDERAEAEAWAMREVPEDA